MTGGLFHDSCGGMLSPETAETVDGREVTLRYCESCDEYADVELGEEWTLTEDQEEESITEILDDTIDDDALTQYRFEGCEHERAILHELSAGRGDEDNLIMYECATCGNTERETYTRW